MITTAASRKIIHIRLRCSKDKRLVSYNVAFLRTSFKLRAFSFFLAEALLLRAELLTRAKPKRLTKNAATRRIAPDNMLTGIIDTG